MAVDFTGTIPVQNESYTDYYKRVMDNGAVGWHSDNPYSMLGKIDDFFFGNASKAKDIYDKWYDEQEAYKKPQIDEEVTRRLRSSELQDFVKDAEAAGLNPYALLMNGYNPGGSVYSGYSSPERKDAKQDESTRGKGIAALAVIIAAIIKAVI